MTILLVFATFVILLAATLLPKDLRARAFSRTSFDWVIDLSGLFVQGVLMPALQIVLGVFVCQKLVPSWHGRWHMGPAAAFCLNFLFVDYLYYWNHRALHLKKLWPIHALHHTAEKLDLLVTSRNTIWTPLFIIYLWVNSLFIFVLTDPTYFLLAASLTASLDLWRHSTFFPQPRTPVGRIFCFALITPGDHAWHHSRDALGVNFGANLNIWDKVHGTFYRSEIYPEKLGTEFKGTAFKKLLFPFGVRQS